MVTKTWNWRLPSRALSRICPWCKRYSTVSLRKVVRVAVDDFGTGYSSFAYLSRLPVNVIKMDKSFLVDVPSDAKAGKTVTAMIAMARELDLEVVAEGRRDRATVSIPGGERLPCLSGFRAGAA